jgi:methylenetetrahydrofolate reductase (NADPH)
MIKKITEIFQERDKTFSLEFFPPKTPKGMENLYKTIGELNRLVPDFTSVTYGAGGSTRGTTLEICDEIQKRFDLTVMHHFTCVGHSVAELKDIISQMKERNIQNILALRGDPPQGVEKWEPAPDGLEFCYQLIKIEHGGELIITQLFFDNNIYSEYLERLRKSQVNVRVLPGILPITSYDGLIKFCNICGATITQEVHDIFRPLKENEEATRKAGIEFAVKQCQDLLDRGAPGLHFFTLNKVEPTREIWNRLGL